MTRQLLRVALFPFAGIAAAGAAPPELGFPAACTLGSDCWIVNYVDVDPAEQSAVDFQCGGQSYDRHKGTDIAVRDWLSMEKGVDVVAAAPGTVIRTRDGDEDRARSVDELREIQRKGRECGNGVLLAHGNGWRTIYCHMKQGSIAVRKGDTVEAGSKLGEVGHSGFVEFPHVHTGVMQKKETVDPFTGLPAGAGCGKAARSLWKESLRLEYQPVSIYAAGFDDAEPRFEDIQRDAAGLERISSDAEVLSFWAAMFGVAEGDRIRMEIRDPDGGILSGREVEQDRSRARQFYYVGKRLREGDLRAGTYTGIVTISRQPTAGPEIVRELKKELTVEGALGEN